MILILQNILQYVEYKPYRIAIPAKWIFKGLVQGLSKKQVRELRSLKVPNARITIFEYPPLYVFFDQFRMKRYLKDDIPPLKPGKMSMILVLLFVWLAFLIFLVAAPLAYYLEQPQWMVDTFCYIALLLLFFAIGTTIWDRSKKRSFRSDFLNSHAEADHGFSFKSIEFPDLSDGEGVVILLIILLAILLAMFFFVFIWLPILFVILNLLTLGRIEDRYRTISMSIENPNEDLINRLATSIIFSGGYLSRNWDPWITDQHILRTAKKTRYEHRSFINFTIIFAISSFIFAFFIVVFRIFPHIYFFTVALILGSFALGIFVYLIFLVFDGRREKKQLFSYLYGH
jgi:hypothetical protein